MEEKEAHSAGFVAIPPVPETHFINCCHLTVGLNAEHVPPHRTGASMYIRPLVFGSSAHLGLTPPDECTFVVYVLPVGVFHGVHGGRSMADHVKQQPRSLPKLCF